MTDDWEELGAAVPSREVLPEEEAEAFQRTLEMTGEILSSPRAARPDLLHYALEGWEEILGYLDDTPWQDRVGEVLELLNEVSRKRHLTFEEAQRGKSRVRTLARFLGLSFEKSAGLWD